MWDVLGNLNVTVSQCELAMSDDNLFFVSRALGHHPSVREAIAYYLAHTQPGSTVHFDVTDNSQLELFAESGKPDGHIFVGGEL